MFLANFRRTDELINKVKDLPDGSVIKSKLLGLGVGLECEISLLRIQSLAPYPLNFDSLKIIELSKSL